MAYEPMQRYRRKDPNSPKLHDTGGSYIPGDIYKVGDVHIPDPTRLAGDSSIERARELYKGKSGANQGLYLRAPSRFGTDPLNRTSGYKRRVHNVIYNGCPE